MLWFCVWFNWNVKQMDPLIAKREGKSLRFCMVFNWMVIRISYLRARNILRLPMLFNSQYKTNHSFMSRNILYFIFCVVFNWNVKKVVLCERSEQEYLYDFVWYLTEIWNKSIFCERSEQENFIIVYGI